MDDIRGRGCAAAGVRLAGEELSGVCRLAPYGARRLLTVFEAPDQCVLLVAEHTRSANLYQLLYAALGIDEPDQPRTKPACCDSEGQPSIDPDLITRFERGLRDLDRRLPGPANRRVSQLILPQNFGLKRGVSRRRARYRVCGPGGLEAVEDQPYRHRAFADGGRGALD